MSSKDISPRVSVLMTAYNAEPFLRESMDSVLAQTYSDWELIVVNDGSMDASAAILAGYGDHRIRVFSLPKNIGRTPALRYAFTQARGECIAVLDADDIAAPERLRREIEFLDSHSDVALVGSWVEQIDEKGRLLNTLTPPKNLNELRDLLGRINPIVHSSVMYRRGSAASVGGYPEQYAYAQDFALILALAQHGKIAVIDEYLCKLRIYSGSMTRSGQYYLTFKREELALLKHAGKILPLSVPARVINCLKVLKCQMGYGLYLLVHGNVLRGSK